MRISTRRMAGGLTAAILVTSVALAQQAPQPGDSGLQRAREPQPQVRQRVPGDRDQAAPRAAAQDKDAIIAGVLAIGNQEEIALAKLALSMTKNQQVHDFAQHMVKDHSQALKDLQQHGAMIVPLRGEAQHPTQQLTGQARPEGEQLQQPPTRQQPAAPAAPGQPAHFAQGQQAEFHHLQVKRDIASKCLEMAKQDLSAKSEHERDMAFAGQQYLLHQSMLASQQVLRDHASPELAATIDKSIAKTQEHLEQARDLIDNLAKHHEVGNNRDNN